ncbi:hypothetical protein GN244_ATG09771 [Phytophthora infestans]|uniref:Uncharacterized protein n=1 Tax=Phytophthora infestans TaxID=4787 RepID=A0A833W187_PHYIN|nr:hypothetical protein GN244_ATG09771 [Phytophthora infestans]
MPFEYLQQQYDQQLHLQKQQEDVRKPMDAQSDYKSRARRGLFAESSVGDTTNANEGQVPQESKVMLANLPFPPM